VPPPESAAYAGRRARQRPRANETIATSAIRVGSTIGPGDRYTGENGARDD